jgi:hypothetical protein
VQGREIEVQCAYRGVEGRWDKKLVSRGRSDKEITRESLLPLFSADKKSRKQEVEEDKDSSVNKIPHS